MLSVCDPAAHHGLSFPAGGEEGEMKGGQGKWAAAKMDGARRPPPTCPEVSGSVEVTPTCLPALRRAGGGMARAVEPKETKGKKSSKEPLNGWKVLLLFRVNVSPP